MALASSSACASEEEEIVFFDVETSAPPRRCALLEFGAVVVCRRRLVEVFSYETLVRPADPDAVLATAPRSNGITRDAVAGAPLFRDVADDIYDVLHGRVWAGHNIVRFDSVIIMEAFAEIGRSPPQPKGMIDTLPLLTQRFGTRAGDMKMASLANYFGLGRQKHRSLDDVRMNLEVLKYCATVLFLEANPREALTAENLFAGAVTRSHANRYPSSEVPQPEAKSSSPGSSKRQRAVSPVENATMDGNNNEPAKDRVSGELVVSHGQEMMLESTMQIDASPSGYSGFVEPDNVSTECIKISVALLHRFGPRTVLQHKGAPLQLFCSGLRVRFGISAKFLDTAGRPKLSIVVEIPENLTKVLGFCDDLAQTSSPEACSDSKWRPLMIQRHGNLNRPTVRLNIPTIVNGNTATYETHMYQKGRDGVIAKLLFRKVDAAELDSLLRWNKVDAYFSPEIYDYQQNAGIRLVAKRLDVHFRWHQASSL